LVYRYRHLGEQARVRIPRFDTRLHCTVLRNIKNLNHASRIKVRFSSIFSKRSDSLILNFYIINIKMILEGQATCRLHRYSSTELKGMVSPD
jgi:hypothetical protein